MRISILFLFSLLFSLTSYAEIARGYSFFISGSGISCEDAKASALAGIDVSNEVASDPTFANNQVTNKSQSLALCAARSTELGFTVTPSDPAFGDASWKADLTGVGRMLVEGTACSKDVETGTFYVTNSANGICLSDDERANPPTE